MIPFHQRFFHSVRVTQSSFKIFGSAFEFREIDVSPPTSTQSAQAKKVFYVYDERNKDWHVVLDAKVRDIYDMGDGESDEVEEIHEQLPHNTSEATQNVNDLIGVSVADNDFFEVDVDNHIDEEDEEGEDINGKKKKLNIGSRMLKESNQGSNATNTTSTHAQGSNDEEAHRTSTHAQGSSAEETHRTLPHAQGSSVEETHSNPTQMEDDTNDSQDSHYIPSDIEAEEAYIEKVVEPKRLRGPTRMQDVWDMDADDIIIVNLDKKGRPTGQEGSNLTRFIGSVSKYEFVPPINDTTREMLKSEINERWKQWKSDLKSKAYDPSKTEEEVASVKPDSRVDLNQWRKLVHHWFSEEGQKISKINRENRAKFKDVHCMGTKSLPKLIDEKKKNSNGRSPTRKEIYIETRTRKDGSIVNENARRVIEKLNKYDNETGTSQSVEEIQKDVNEILRAARQVTNASNAPDQTDSPSSYTDKD
ncbi:hypothetical protein QL285_032598 [Trifolium repens]|nr:hypothetical protein QL285_032598 [Trifolium repens]